MHLYSSEPAGSSASLMQRAGFRIWLAAVPLAGLVGSSSAAVGLAAVAPPPELAVAVAATRGGRCQEHLAALRTLSERRGPPGARAGYLLGHCLRKMGRSDEARTVFDTVAVRYPPLAVYAYLAAAETFLPSQAPEAAARLARLLQQPLSDYLARRVRLLYSQALLKSNRAAEVEGVLRVIPGEALDDKTAAQLWWLRGVAAQVMGSRSRALLALGMVWWGIPGNPHAEDAARRLRDLHGGRLPVAPPPARLARAKWLLARGLEREAEDELVVLLHTGPPAQTAAEAWYYLGLARLRSRGAGHAFRQAARDPAWAARARYWEGRALARAGDTRQAEAAWRRAIGEHPSDPWAARSLLALAYLFEDRAAWTEADAVLKRLAADFPKTSWGDEARWRRGWLRYRRRRYAEAETLFLRWARDFPTAARAAANLYWAAQARQRQGRDGRALLEEAAARYPLTYYGQRARERLGWEPPARAVQPTATSLRSDRFHPAHEELGALGFPLEAAAEAEDLFRSTHDPDLQRAAAYYHASAGNYHASVAAAEEAIAATPGRAVPEDTGLWMLAYPRAYWEIVKAAAKVARVDPYLVLAVIREESRFDRLAISPAGAVGLMQLLPATAREIAGGAASPQLVDPSANVRLGVPYLGGLLHLFGGDVVLALAAYNAGAGAARRFALLPRSTPEEFIERIPYAETRAYVRRVVESYGIYRWLYR